MKTNAILGIFLTLILCASMVFAGTLKQETRPLAKQEIKAINQDYTKELSNLQIKKTYLIEYKEQPVLEFSSNLLLRQKKASFKELSSDEKNLVKQVKADLEQKQAGNLLAIKSALGREALEAKMSFVSVFNGASIDLTEQELTIVRELPFVENVFENLEVKSQLREAIGYINADDVWQLNSNGDPCNLHDPSKTNECLDGSGITIGIIDSGVDYTHIDLGDCLGPNCKVIGGFDFVNNDADPKDDFGHGTHVASIAAGNGTIKGVAPNAKIVAYKVLNSGGSGSIDYVIAGIERSVDPNQDGDYSDHLDIINLSLGVFCAQFYSTSCGPSDAQSIAVDNAVNNGVIAVVAAGNIPDRIASPATSKNAITVGAMCRPDQIGNNQHCQSTIAAFSARGHTPISIKPDVVAPGVAICAAQWNNYRQQNQCMDSEHTAISGTSMAAPLVAGTIALMKQKNNSLTAKQAKDILKYSSFDLDFAMKEQGYGAINSFRAVFAQTPPHAELLTRGEINSLTKIIGTASGKYSLYFTANAFVKRNLQEWTLICTNNKNIENEPLCENGLNSLPEGEYLLKLVVENESSTLQSFDEAVVQKVDAKISSPLNATFFTRTIIPTHKKIIEVKGTAVSPQFGHYELSFCNDSQVCYPQRIEIQNPQSQVTNSDLGKITIEGLQSGYYTIVLTVFNSENSIWANETSKFYVDAELKEGWPLSLMDLTGSLVPSFVTNPTIADFDGDGMQEIIFAYEKKIFIFKHNGEIYPGWPVEIQSTCINSSAIMQIGPVVDDIDTDGKKEIIAGDNCGFIHVIKKDGQYLPNWPKNFYSYVDSITVADIDNNNKKEILFATWDKRLHVVDQGGNELSGWPYTSDSKIIGSPAVHDFDNDGFMEIVIKTKDSQNLVDTINVLRHDGIIAEGWPKTIGICSDKLIADIDNDSVKEIIAIGMDGVLHAFNFDGTEKIGFPRLINGFANESTLTYISVGDIDKDNSLDILFTGNAGVWATNNVGELKPGFPIFYNPDLIRSAPNGVPLIGQLDSDNELEFTVSMVLSHTTSNDPIVDFYAFNHDGTIVQGFPKKVKSNLSLDGVQIADLDNDGLNEIIAVDLLSRIYIWNSIGQTEQTWGKFYFNEQHTGCFNCAS